MRSFTLLTTVVVLSLAGMLAPVAAAPATDTPTNSTAGARPAEQIDANTRLVSSSYDPQNETASVVIESERAQAITVSDAGAFTQGGEIPRRTVVVDDGERVTVELPVTTVNGKVGLAISTDETLYAEVITVNPDDSLFQGRPTWQDMQVAGFSGFVGGLLVISLVAWHRVKSDQGEVERIL